METLVLIASVYLLFAVPCGLICAIAWALTRKHLRLCRGDWLLLVLPWILWLALSNTGYRPKTLSNLFEAVPLGVITGLCFFARAWAATTSRRSQSSLALSSLAASSFAAVILWAFVPALPE
jgi:hypothetical protein